MNDARNIYINLPVQNLEGSRTFFAQLGFKFNPQFSDKRAACMIVNEQTSVMLLEREFFDSFTERRICDPRSDIEVLLALSCAERDAVDSLTHSAVTHGGSEVGTARDQGFMYTRSFCDLDGHQWEAVWMDPATIDTNAWSSGKR